MRLTDPDGPKNLRILATPSGFDSAAPSRLCFGETRSQGTLSHPFVEMETAMAKGYWVATYRSISDPDALAGYAKLAGPAIEAAGGRFLARGTAAKAYEAGVIQRVVIIEFDSVEKAAAAHDSAAYQEALRVLGKGADRDLRIVAGVE
jgi:uncharacterized protein (DUF1330 family)